MTDNFYFYENKRAFFIRDFLRKEQKGCRKEKDPQK